MSGVQCGSDGVRVPVRGVTDEGGPGPGGDLLQQRTKSFALRVIRLANALAPTRVGDLIGKQALRSGASVGANYRAACRARSRAEFVAKLGIVEEECDETVYWLELLGELKIIKPPRLQPLMVEADEILAMVVASIKTARARKSVRPLVK